MQTTVRILESLEDIDPNAWDRLAGSNPFVRHAFLHGLQATGCTTSETGWAPCHLTLWRDEVLVGAMPLYLKDHSYGEYVFDWAWAEAYHRHGLEYYPKLLCAVPFTPISGPRLIAESEADRALLLKAALALAEECRASSLHILFPPEIVVQECEKAGMMLRRSVQFHWTNQGYRNFDEFLAGLTREKRKKIRQERRRVQEQGVSFRWISGADATEADWTFFERCYRRTYREHHSTPYMNRDFFLYIAERMPKHLLLIEARLDNKPIAANFSVLGDGALFGRNWGAIVHIPLLHFEACYYQSIEYCIANGIQRFEGGAQGRHKMARGLMPVEKVSAHWVAHREFQRAISEYLGRETQGILGYVDELNERSPYAATT